MATPNIFLHYWNDSAESITFQEVLAWEVPTPIVEAIQIELLAQLNSSQAVQAFPNFPWESSRFEEKWAGIAQTLLYQVALPEFIWVSWIESHSVPATEIAQPSFADLLNSYEAADAPVLEEFVEFVAAETPAEPFDYPAAETPAEPFDLLKSEVYFLSLIHI